MIDFLVTFWWFLPAIVFFIVLADGLFLLITGRERGLVDFWQDL